MRNQSVLVSGASIAGPTLAYWLHRYGFDVTVVERAPRLRPGGQAIDFKGPTHRTVLERMGVWEEITRQRTGTTDLVFADESGRELAVMSGDFTGGDVEILRGDLARILYERTAGKCEYLFGDSIAGLSETADGVHVEFEHAPARTFDLVFGTDGIHSRVRRLAFGPERDYVHYLGYYYCIAGTAGLGHDPDEPPVRIRSTGYNAPGRLAVRGGFKAAQHYIFASPEIDIPRDDVHAQQRILADAFAGIGGPVPAMLAELPGLEDFYLDSLSQVRLDGHYTKGRFALVGDSGYGNTLGGFGTGLALVGAYVLAGELAVAGGDHTLAFARYDEIMRRYAKIAGNSNAGRFLAPRTARGIRMRNWFFRSRSFALMTKYADRAAKDIDLRDYPALVGAAV
ncbi:FAD-dependent monooxygenase [Nocardia alni]|uniref:FAD-dependent monooxygenase n=1 Tax=Nocardia alni TaxID=2815723 RepID=UPI001C218A2E|nr:FAD-dependent monooxygenase [Nocardia alni]